MIVSLFILLSSISGILLSYMLGNRRTGLMIPVSFMSIVVILYLFGLIGALKNGVIVVDVLIGLIYLGFILWIIFHWNNRKMLIRDLFPPVVIWTLFIVVFSYADNGMMTHNWDEFSHWASTVKIMTYLDDFATNEASTALFKNYPPAMSLLQFFFQRNKMFIKGDNAFTEWRLYLTYHLFAVSFLMPIFDNKEQIYRKIFKCLTCIWICVLFYRDMLECLYIDPFVALVGGYSVLSIVFTEKKDRLHLLNMTLALMCLVLSKDVGMYFVLMIGILFLIDSLEYSLKKILSFKFLYGIVPMIFAFCTKILWKNELYISGVASKPMGLSGILSYIRMIILRDGTGYKQEVVNNAFRAAFDKRLDLGLFKTSYSMMFIFLTLILAYSLTKLNKDIISARKIMYVFIISAIIPLLYVMMIGLVYVNNFSEYEAVRLASYERYVNMPFVCYGLIAVYCFNDSFINKTLDRDFCVVMAVLIGIVFGLNGSIYNYLSRNDAKRSRSFENDYIDIYSTLCAYCTIEDRVYFISIADTGIDHLVAQYKTYPYRIIDDSWSLGGPYFDGDIWSNQIAPSDWMDKLAKSFDYVYIHKVRDEFIDEYSELFEDVSSVDSGSLFKVDRDNRLLIRCNP